MKTVTIALLMKNETEPVLDPTGRYRRCDIVGNGSFKIVYRAYDQEEGIEVAWNEIIFDRFTEQESAQIRQEISILHNLDHPSVLRIFTAWLDKLRNVMIFITEFFTNGTIRAYVSDVVRSPTRSVISKWCRQILDGLNYLHTHDPPVIHRDLKCDNLFIDASEGIVKIGDFGLSKLCPNGLAESCLGTPAYTAPEVYTGRYTTKADIWSFGLCVLEMVTGETPFAECTHIGAIYMKVSAGTLPLSLSKVSDPVVADFITLCLLEADLRPSAEELLEHPLIKEFEQLNISPTDERMDDGEKSGLLAIKLRQEQEIISMQQRHHAERKKLIEQLRARRNLSQSTI